MLARILSMVAALVFACASTQTHAYARALLSESALPARAMAAPSPHPEIAAVTPSRTKEICPPLRECTSTLGVTGYRKDEDTGLYYAQARWYDPLVGNFNAMDPAFGKAELPITFNKYLYANANPICFVDPSGRAGTETQLEQYYAAAAAAPDEVSRQVLMSAADDYERARDENGAFFIGIAEVGVEGAVATGEQLLRSHRARNGDSTASLEQAQQGLALLDAARHPVRTYDRAVANSSAQFDRVDELEAMGDKEGANRQRGRMVAPFVYAVAPLLRMPKVPHAGPHAPSTAPKSDPPNTMGDGAGTSHGEVAVENPSAVTTPETASASSNVAAKPDPLGGAYKDVPANCGEIHHCPADSVSPLSTAKGPGFRMEKAHHQRTASWGRSKAAQAYRRRQQELIDAGRFSEAQQMDINDARQKFGDQYDEGIDQMLEYTKTLDPEKLKPKKQ